MTVTNVTKDPEALTMVTTAEFTATPERVWRLWEDPAQLSRWWGPPAWPATFTKHDLRVGGRSAYHMTGPDGSESHGWWEVTEAEPPRRLAFRDGFANPDGSNNDELPGTESRITIEPIGDGRTRMSITSQFPSLEAMQQLVEMGMEEGLKEALGQIDGILAEDPA
ncbi:MAG: SRPBCC domain-containing protein [Chloroflexi bacterium]|nr:SRPBCC domain-containing protein [Chloroflexota bacterium]